MSASTVTHYIFKVLFSIYSLPLFIFILRRIRSLDDMKPFGLYLKINKKRNKPFRKFHPQKLRKILRVPLILAKQHTFQTFCHWHSNVAIIAKLLPTLNVHSAHARVNFLCVCVCVRVCGGMGADVDAVLDVVRNNLNTLTSLSKTCSSRKQEVGLHFSKHRCKWTKRPVWVCLLHVIVTLTRPSFTLKTDSCEVTM